MKKKIALKNVILNPYKLLSWFLTKVPICGNRVSDTYYLKIKYRSIFGKKLELDNPITFNEKLQWLKLYDRNKKYTRMVDKFEVKKYVADKIGKQHVIKTIGVWDRFEDIDFSQLPNRFVLKCTHDSGGVIVCKNKAELDYNEVEKKIKKSLKRNYYYSGREWPYKNVKPRVIAEEYMSNGSEDLKDYKFFCFDGKVEVFKIDFNRFVEHHANYYDKDGKLLGFGEVFCPPKYNEKIDLPQKLCQMKEFAEMFAKDIPFLRVDFYEIEGEVYFGEFTFYPNSGLGRFTDDSWDVYLGKLIELSK